MNIVHALNHSFLPGRSNNFKARLLHTISIVALAQVVLILFFTFQFLSAPSVAVLGYAADIPAQKVVELTNQKRVEQGVGALVLNESLAEAARLKGLDMLEKDYWAHVSPTGTEPWDFFKTAGYSYRFAGENLARDFTSAEDTVEAWLASPSHRENMLSGKYTEIGIAVVEGDLGGKDTTLIVQFFGAPSTGGSAITVASAGTDVPRPVVPEPTQIVAQEPKKLATNEPVVSAEAVTVASSFDAMKGATLMIVSVMLLVLTIDVIVISRRGITRLSGKAFAHLSFFAMIFIILLLIRSGHII